MRKLLINGLFFSQKTTGVHRYARELLSELDKIIKKGDISIGVPQNVISPEYENINKIVIGKHQGLIWEQWDFPKFASKNSFTTVNLCNSQPLLRPGIICIHDVAYKTHPEYFKTLHGKLSLIWHKIVYRQAASFTKYPILTVSFFSKYSIIDTYKVHPSRVNVVSNGWQHITNTEGDDNILQKQGLAKGDFYFTLGNINYNKNTKWVIDYAQKHPNDLFVLSGVKVKNSQVDIEHTPNVRYLDFLSDSEIVTLYRNCKAFIFPSIHEGFGIPPMEALCHGAQIIIANTTCLPEIYQSSAHYIDAYDTDVNLDEILSKPVCGAENVLDRYGWDISARKFKMIIDKYVKS